MRQRTLAHLACPARREEAPFCGGSLSLHENGLPPRWAAAPASDELLEGTLRCERCGAEYPVLSGVLILVRDVAAYMTRYCRAVLSAAALHGTVSDALARWLERHHPDAPGLQVTDQPLDVNLPGSMDRLSDLVGGDARYGTFARFLKEWQGRSPYDRLSSFARTLGAAHDLAIDSGCGAGAMALRLSSVSGYVLGVDHAFAAVLLARRLLLHQPRPKEDYELRRSADAFELRSTARALAAAAPMPGGAGLPLDNADFIVADSMDLPLADATAGLVAGANILEAASQRAVLRESSRVLRPGGLLLLTDPFQATPEVFSDRAADPVASLRRFLEGLGLSVELEEDFVPWIHYQYDRHFEVHLNYCAAARKSGGGGGASQGN
jgi:SAM-dependent methyltransferase/uncharacterized protein YbaR (Trm112 family)